MNIFIADFEKLLIQNYCLRFKLPYYFILEKYETYSTIHEGGVFNSSIGRSDMQKQFDLFYLNGPAYKLKSQSMQLKICLFLKYWLEAYISEVEIPYKLRTNRNKQEQAHDISQF